MTFRALVLAAVTALGLASHIGQASAAQPLRIGFSDWPGWTGWQIAIDKGWFKQAGVDVDMQWFDYSASLDAFAAGKIDGDFVSNNDSLVMGAGGAKNKIILLTDYSSGNDMILARPGIHSIKDLAGKKVALEVGITEHLLLEYGLKQAGMSLSDVTLVNANTADTPQVLASGAVAAIGVWTPTSTQAEMQVPGSRPIFTSAQAPGLIFDGLAVSPASFAQRKADWMKVQQVWYRIVAYINDPKTAADALKIMAARDGVDPTTYKRYVNGTHILSQTESVAAYKPSDALTSLFGSDAYANAFNISNKVYKTNQDPKDYIDDSLLVDH
jgi:NitT/TauT family transport system substrate-binding protein